MAVEQSRWTPPQVPDPSPLHRLRERLEVARNAGQEFAPAWGEALQLTLREVPDHNDRVGWRRALESTKAAWERCYQREPAQDLDRQLRLVTEDRDTPTSGRECLRCGGEVTRRDPRAVYCSDRCRREGMPVAA